MTKPLYSTVQYSTVQYSTVQYFTEQYSLGKWGASPHIARPQLLFNGGGETAVPTQHWGKEGHGHSLSAMRGRGGRCILVDTGGECWGSGHCLDPSWTYNEELTHWIIQWLCSKLAVSWDTSQPVIGVHLSSKEYIFSSEKHLLVKTVCLGPIVICYYHDFPDIYWINGPQFHGTFVPVSPAKIWNPWSPHY